MKVIESDDRIEGFCHIDGWEGMQSVIAFMKNGDKWVQAGSMCLPSSLEQARNVHDCQSAAFRALDVRLGIEQGGKQ